MSEANTVAMFVHNENGEKVQVGWASPKNETGVRTIEMSPGFEDIRAKDVSFDDDENSQEIAELQFESRDPDGTDGDDFEVVVSETDTIEETLPAEPVDNFENASENEADPVEDYVSLNNGGTIVDIYDDEDQENEEDSDEDQEGEN